MKNAPFRPSWSERGIFCFSIRLQDTAKPRNKAGNKRKGAWKGNSTIDPQNRSQGQEMAFCGIGDEGSNSHEKSIHILHKSRSPYFTKCSHGHFRTSRYTFTPSRKTPLKSSKCLLRAINTIEYPVINFLQNQEILIDFTVR